MISPSVYLVDTEFYRHVLVGTLSSGRATLLLQRCVFGAKSHGNAEGSQSSV